MDLSRIIIDDTIPPTPGGGDNVYDETDDSVHIVSQKVKDTNVEASIQPTPEGLEALVVPSAVDPSATDGPSVIDPITDTSSS